MVTWVTQEMLYNGDDYSVFVLDCMESNGVRPRTAQKQLLVAFEACNTMARRFFLPQELYRRVRA